MGDKVVARVFSQVEVQPTVSFSTALEWVFNESDHVAIFVLADESLVAY